MAAKLAIFRRESGSPFCALFLEVSGSPLSALIRAKNWGANVSVNPDFVYDSDNPVIPESFTITDVEFEWSDV